jgi:hypothetical protein
MLPQTSIAQPTLGYEGQFATSDNMTNQVWPFLNTTSAPVPFGRFVVRDPSNFGVNGAGLPQSLTDRIIGVTAFDPVVEADSTGVRAYAPGKEMNVLRQGSILMIPEQDVGPGDAVFARCIVDGSDATKTPGRCRKDDGGSGGNTKDKFTLTLSADLADPDNVIGVTVDSTVLTQAAAGSLHADDTLEALAAQIRVLPHVGSAVVTKVAGASTNDRVLTVEADLAGLGRLTLTSATITGTTPPTFTLARTATGADSTAKAVRLDGYEYASVAAAGTPVLVRAIVS